MGLYWERNAEDVCYLWGVRRDRLFESVSEGDSDGKTERYACQAVAFRYWWSGWGYWAVSREFHYDMTRDELAGFERLPVAMPLIGRGPFSVAVRVAMEDIAALPLVDKDTVSEYLSRMPPISTVRFLRAWWRTTVSQWYDRGCLWYWAASVLADIRMKGPPHEDDSEPDP